MKHLTIVAIGAIGAAASTPVVAAPVYLNDANTTVELGASMAAEPFANRNTADSLASLIDAPSADASELHLQTTHVWVSGGQLEVDFDFGEEYNLSAAHFWNYHTEGFDVDDIDLIFLDGSSNEVDTLSNVAPALGNATGTDADPIFAEDIALSVNGVRFVNVIFSGSNSEVDFTNLGFTGELVDRGPDPEPNPIPLPPAAWTGLATLAGFTAMKLRRRKASE